MNVAIERLRRHGPERLKQDEYTLLRCALAKASERAGNYEAAVAGLGELWRGVGSQPALAGLGDYAKAEVLLRVGALTGWLGSVRPIAGGPEGAEDFISAS